MNESRRLAPISTPSSLVDQVHDALVEAICDGRLAPGDVLRQERLAAEFGVSRQPVLQALLLLERQGWLRKAGRRGVEVAPIDPAFVRDLFAVRGALDGLAARTAARLRPSAAEGAAVIAAGRAAVKGRKPRDVAAADMAFHQLVYALSGNALIGEAAAPHWRQIRRVMALSAASNMEHVWDEHEAILAAVVAGRGEEAERLARRHAEANASSLAQALETAARDAA